MLTSYHYWLSGFTAAFFATGILHFTAVSSQRLLPGFSEQALPEAGKVSYRGSGRCGNCSNEGREKDNKPLIVVHRGSGRIQSDLS